MIKRVALLLTCFLLFGARSVDGVARQPGAALPITRFPPSFEDSAFAYGFALFGLTLIASVSAAILFNFMFDKRIRHDAVNEFGDTAFAVDCPSGSPCQLYRFQLGALLWTMLLGTLPDILLLLAWGEAPLSVMWTLYQLDRVGDGLASIPFGMFALSYLLSGNVIEHKLALDGGVVPLRPRWVQVKEKGKIVIWASVIALGVTAYKAGLA